MKKIVSIVYLCIVVVYTTFSQHTSKNNYTGNWENSNSWIPAWATPQTSGISQNITIYGKITRNGDLSFGGSGGDLIVNDTLIILGNLDMGNNNNITVNDGGVLIITGNLTIANKVDIAANAYVVVLGNFTKSGASNQGSFTSNDQPSKVYIGGTITIPSGWASSGSTDVFNCNLAIEHDSTQCNYGNFADILQDSIINVVNNVACSSKPTIISQPVDATVCDNNTGTFSITASNVSTYQWQRQDGTIFVNLINAAPYSGVTTSTLSITPASLSMNGYVYRCVLKSSNNCIAISTTAKLFVTNAPVTGPTYHKPNRD